MGNNYCLQNLKTSEVTCPDISNQTSISSVCHEISSSACDEFKSCCEDAWKCCETQLTRQSYSNQIDPGACPQTWDGWQCWNYTQTGTTSTQSCPSFLNTLHLSGEGKVQERK